MPRFTRCCTNAPMTARRWPPSAASARRSWNVTARSFWPCCKTPDLVTPVDQTMPCFVVSLPDLHGVATPEQAVTGYQPYWALAAHPKAGIRNARNSFLALRQRQIGTPPGIQPAGERGDVGEAGLDQPLGSLARLHAVLAHGHNLQVLGLGEVLVLGVELAGRDVFRAGDVALFEIRCRGQVDHQRLAAVDHLHQCARRQLAEAAEVARHLQRD